MIDVARSVPELARANVDWREADASSLPFGDATFDLVTCQQSLQFFPDRLAALKEFRRVLKSGGRFVANTWLGLNEQPTQGPLRSEFSREFGIPEAAAATPFSLGDSEEIRALLVEAGFSQVTVEIHPFRATYPSAAMWAEHQFTVAAATMPAYADISVSDRRRGLTAVNEKIAPVLAPYLNDDGSFTAIEPMNIAIGFG
jgi:SAM-dependent methyltransferase